MPADTNQAHRASTVGTRVVASGLRTVMLTKSTISFTVYSLGLEHNQAFDGFKRFPSSLPKEFVRVAHTAVID
jgi:hypothetical protein